MIKVRVEALRISVRCDVSLLLQEHPTLINQLVGMSILALEVDTISHFDRRPTGQHIPMKSWNRLRWRWSWLWRALTPLTLEGEYIMFDDVLQRVYSDNGSGNGIFIGESGTWSVDDGAGFTGFPIVLTTD